jgi:hypothetical protein
MRIKVLQTPRMATVDGIDLQRFVPGQKYEVGNRLGALFLSEGWAEPVPDDEPALLIPFSDADPFTERVIDRNTPPNLVRETYPPYVEPATRAADFERRRSARTRSRSNQFPT